MNDFATSMPPDSTSQDGVIPLGSMYLAISNKWHDKDQERANRFFEEWVRMLQDEMREIEATILEIMARLDLQDENIA